MEGTTSHIYVAPRTFHNHFETVTRDSRPGDGQDQEKKKKKKEERVLDGFSVVTAIHCERQKSINPTERTGDHENSRGDLPDSRTWPARPLRGE